MLPYLIISIPIFFNDTATTEIYTLSLHDALPIFPLDLMRRVLALAVAELFALELWRAAGDLDLRTVVQGRRRRAKVRADRKSTRLYSSHDQISYAVFCLKKKK